MKDAITGPHVAHEAVDIGTTLIPLWRPQRFAEGVIALKPVWTIVRDCLFHPVADNIIVLPFNIVIALLIWFPARA